jgi:hypothetical protein
VTTIQKNGGGAALGQRQRVADRWSRSRRVVNVLWVAVLGYALVKLL